MPVDLMQQVGSKVEYPLLPACSAFCNADHIHLTPVGYLRAAIAFTDALMRRYGEALVGAAASIETTP